MRVCLFFSLLSSTLFFDSFLGFQGLSLYGTLFFFCLILLSGRNNYFLCGKVDFLSVLFILFFVCLSASICFFKYNMDFVVLKPYIAILINIVIFLLLYPLALSERVFVLKSIRYLICLNLFIISLQFFLWHLFNVDLNIGGGVGGSGHRAFGYDGEYRLTGMFDEPGIYSIFMFCLFVVKYIFLKRLEKTDAALFLSVLMTNSIFGFILILLFFMWVLVFIDIKVYVKLAATLIFISIITVMVCFFIPRFNVVLGGGDYSAITKMILIDDYFFNSDLLFYFGVGLLPLDYWPNVGYQAMGDMTFWLSTLIIYGIPLGSLLVIGVLYLITGGILNKWTILSLIPLLKLTMLSWTFFWIYILLIRIALNRDKEQKYD